MWWLIDAHIAFFLLVPVVDTKLRNRRLARDRQRGRS
jgi:hypothetical protein